MTRHEEAFLFYRSLLTLVGQSDAPGAKDTEVGAGAGSAAALDTTEGDVVVAGAGSGAGIDMTEGDALVNTSDDVCVRNALDCSAATGNVAATASMTASQRMDGDLGEPGQSAPCSE